MNTLSRLDDPPRLAALRRSGLLDTPPLTGLDRLTRLAAQLLRAPVALVSLVDEHRVVFKSQFGLPEPWRSSLEASRDFSFCPRVVEAGTPVIVSSVGESSRPEERLEMVSQGYVAYMGIPLNDPEGNTLGCFCVIDRQPRSWRSGEIGLLSEIAASVWTEFELHQQSRELEQTRDVLDRWLAHNPLACLSVSDDLEITSWNTEASRLFGYTSVEMIGSSLRQLLAGPEQETALAASLRSAGRTGAAGVFDAECRTASQRVFLAEWRVTPASARPARNNGFIATVTDLSARAQETAERTELESRLRRAQGIGALGTLAGGVAHEFNNVLGGILGHVELARREMGDAAGNPTVIEALDRIGSAGIRARDLVNSILRHVRGESSRPQRISLAPVLNETARLLRPAMPRAVELEVRCSGELPQVEADSTQVQQVLLNLVGNSLHAIGQRPGRIELSVEAAAPSKSPTADPSLKNAVRVRVRDNGCGMDEATARRVFEPFFTTKRACGGTGLGLSIVRSIMDTHGGVIEVASEPGQGTTFDLYFPAATATAPASGQNSPIPPMAGRGAHIWLLDDEEALVSMASRALQRLGYQVSGFTDCNAALERFRANPNLYEVAVVDLNMPQYSGIEVAKLLRVHRPDMPVVISTGFCTPETREAVHAAGICGVLEKPLTIDELARGIQQAAAGNTLGVAP